MFESMLAYHIITYQISLCLICNFLFVDGSTTVEGGSSTSGTLKGKYFRNATAYGNQVPEQCLNDLGTNISISRILKFIKVQDIGVRCTLYIHTFI